jgi:UDP-GlcNAc:undecaprenyl-phosphate/decaprenyl-phosphate GlcNAc-1-phosphate transferase
MADRIIIGAAVFLVSYLLSTILIFPLRAAARRWGIVDIPGGRKGHREPVPLLGGMAILGSLAAVISIGLILLPFLESSFKGFRIHSTLHILVNYVAIKPKLWALASGSLLIASVGVVDDVRGGLSPLFKLAMQVAAAVFLLMAGIQMDLASAIPVLGALASILWVVGITNSFNLLDNMNGLSSGTALICSSVFLALVMFKGEFFIALLLTAIIGATLGFFQFNIRSGSIFMGDAGSLLLGYLLGAITLMARYVDADSSYLLPVLAPLMILGLPIFDTFSVIVIRMRRHRSIFVGDQMHLSHRLVRMGMTPRQAVGFHYLMAFTFAVNSLLMINSRILHSLVALFQVAALAAMVSILMTTVTRRDSAGSSRPAPSASAAGMPSIRPLERTLGSKEDKTGHGIESKSGAEKNVCLNSAAPPHE